ncbi:MAG: patatin-like phospholipase family protein [Bacteroidota bacterium]
MVCKYRVILSIDGGGQLGVIPLRILDYLHTAVTDADSDLDVTSWVDVFSSTSASSIFTGALMLKDEDGKSKYTPKDLLRFYEKRGSQMFNRNIGNDASNSTYPLNFVLEHFFGDVSLNSFKNHFLFVSYNKTHNELFSFSNSLDRYRDLPLSKVMNACSATLGLFPPLCLDNNDFVDAKFLFQNPALMSYEYARFFYPTEPIILISIGTGEFSNKKNEVSLEQSKKIHDELISVAEHDKRLIYFRYQPKLDDEFCESDFNFTHTERLKDITNQFITDNKFKFEELIEFIALKTA